MEVIESIKKTIQNRKTKKIEDYSYLKISLSATNENGIIAFPEMAAQIYKGMGRPCFQFNQIVRAKDSQDRHANVYIRIEMLD